MVSLALLAIMISPRVIDGDYHEMLDPLVFFALPFLVLCAGIGALIGAKPRAALGPEPRSRSWAARRPAGLVVAGVAILVAVWTMAWAMGFVDVSPLGLG